MSTNRNAFLALAALKIETTPGTDSTPTVAANAIECTDIVAIATSMAVETPRNKVISGSTLHSPPLVPKGRWATFTLRVHLRGTKNGLAYSAGNLPEPDPILRMAGFKGTLVTTGGAETVTYAPISPTQANAGFENATFYYYVDGKLYKVTGVIASSLTLDIPAGGPIMLEAQCEGLYQGQTDVTFPTTQAFGTSIAPTADNVNLVIAGSYTTAIVRSHKVMIKNTTTGPRLSLDAPGAIIAPTIRSRTIDYTLVAENPNNTDFNFESYRDAQTPLSLSWALPGAQYVGAISLTQPNSRIAKCPPGQDKDTEMVNAEGGCFATTQGGNDALALVFA